MKITFHIHELGRLKDTSFDLHPFLIFTGDSNLGKSYCAFLVHGFFRMLRDKDFMKKFILPQLILSAKKNHYTFQNEDLNLMYKKFISNYLQYLVGNENTVVNVDLELSQKISLEYEFYPEIIRNPDELPFVIRSLNSKICESLFLSSYSLISFLFPPARGSLMGSSFSMKKAISSIGMYEVFLEDLDRISYNIEKDAYTIEKDFAEGKMNEMLAYIFNGEIKYERQSGNYSYQFQNKEIPLVSAASSIKELAPLFLLLKKRELGKINLLFEEPESHLHPSMQRKLADLLAYMVNNGAYLQITTHSDYMLSEWNNLLRLHFIKEKNQAAFEQVIEETNILPECALNPNLVGAYYFQDTENGVKLIKSEITETQQIQFDSFKDTINQMNENRYVLKEMLEELNTQEHESAN